VGREIVISVVELNSVDMNTSEPTVFNDLFFSSIDIGNEASQHVQVVNDSGLPVEYEWVWLETNEKDLHKAGQHKILQRQQSDEEILNGDLKTKDLDGEDEISKTSLLKSIDDSESFSNCVKENGFSLTPARGVLPSEGSERFTITFSPPRVMMLAFRAVLIVKAVPFAALIGKDQHKYLESLEVNGHGKFPRLRSWVEDLGSAAAVDDYVKSNGDVSQSKQLVNLSTLINLVLKQTGTDNNEDDTLTQEYARMNGWIRKLIRHVFEVRRNAAIADEPSSDDDDGVEKVDDTDHSRAILLDLYDSSDINSVIPKPLYPLELNYTDCKILAGTKLQDIAKLLRQFTGLDNELLSETWLDVKNALLLMGDYICNILDLQVNHEAVEYLKDCSLTNLACLHFRVFGEGKPRIVEISPPILDIGGYLSIGKSWTGSFTLRNSGDAMTEVHIDTRNIAIISELCSKPLGGFPDNLSFDIKDDHDILKDFAFKFSTERALLMPKGSESISVTCQICRVGKYTVILPFKTDNDAVRVDSLRIAVNMTGPRLRFDLAEMDLGLIGVGADGFRHLSFTNEGDAPAYFMVKPSLFVDIAAAPRKQSDKSTSGRINSHRDNHHNKDAGGNLSSRSKLSTGRSDDFSVQDSAASSAGDFKIGIL